MSVTPADITLGSIPSQGTGWHLLVTVNDQIGQIDIQLFSDTPIAVDQAGSLVNIAFHVKSTQTAAIRLLPSDTVLADAQGSLALSPALDWTTMVTAD